MEGTVAEGLQPGPGPGQSRRIGGLPRLPGVRSYPENVSLPGKRQGAGGRAGRGRFFTRHPRLSGGALDRPAASLVLGPVRRRYTPPPDVAGTVIAVFLSHQGRVGRVRIPGGVHLIEGRRGAGREQAGPHNDQDYGKTAQRLRIDGHRRPPDGRAAAGDSAAPDQFTDFRISFFSWVKADGAPPACKRETGSMTEPFQPRNGSTMEPRAMCRRPGDALFRDRLRSRVGYPARPRTYSGSGGSRWGAGTVSIPSWKRPGATGRR